MTLCAPKGRGTADRAGAHRICRPEAARGRHGDDPTGTADDSTDDDERDTGDDVAARDLYSVFADRYGVAIFSRIAVSEQRHYDATGILLTRCQVADPAAGAKAGIHENAAVQRLYDGWKTSGLTSLPAADKAAIALENRDIADLRRLQAATATADLDRVYANLERGSDHHLAAFTAAANGTAQAIGAGRNSGSGMTGTTPGHHGRGSGSAAHGCMMN